MNKIIDNKIFFLILSLIVSIPFLINLPKIKTVDNVDYFTIEDDPDLEFYDEIRKIFGNDEFFIIAYKNKNIFKPENLAILKQITDDLNQISGIRQIKSIANVNDIIGEDEFFIVQKFLETIPEHQEDINKLKISALSNPLYIDNFISNDGETVAIVVSVYDKPDVPEYRKKIIEKSKVILQKYSENTGKVYMAGWTSTNYYLSQYMKDDIRTFIPVTYFFITIAVFFFFKNLWLTLLALLNVSICMGSTMGLFPLFDITLNNVTTIVPPVVMALALCDTIHIFSYLNSECLIEFKSKENALAHILKKVFKPCLLTTLTTAIGFFSLYLSEIPPIKDFALVASLGMLFEFFFSFLFLPPLLLLFDERKIFFNKNENKTITIFLKKIGTIVTHEYKSICAISVLIIIISCWFSSTIKIETNLLDYFKKKDEVKIAIDFIEENLAGISTLDIILKSTTKEGFKYPKNLEIIQSIQTFSSTIKGVDKSLSFVDFIKDINQSFNNEEIEYYKIPKSKALISQYLLLYDSEDINDFINSMFDRARISLRLSEHSTRAQAKIISSISNYVKQFQSNDIEIRISGRALQDVNTIDALVAGQIYSLSAAVVIIILIMFFVLRSVPLGMLSIVPNIFPIVFNFGIMGLFGIPLNTATAIIAAVAIGIAVDDTIHFLSEFRWNLDQGKDVEEAIVDTIHYKGKAILLSSVILAIGFGVMIFSRFVPTINFGALTSIIMVAAVIGDLLILPSMALFFLNFDMKTAKH
ncbi:MAG: MMPL family transporter [Desulfobacula sp.]|nr:MMPL family transporter [Desulfobacula sp.]